MKKNMIFKVVLILVFSCTCVLAGESILSNQDNTTIIRLLEKKSISKIAFIGFVKKPEQIKQDELYSLIDEINNEFVRMGNYKLEVIIRDKEELKKMVGELKFQTDVMVDPDSVRSMGKILGVGGLVYGNLFSDKMNLRVVNVETGQMLWSRMIDISAERQEKLYPVIQLGSKVSKIIKPAPTRRSVLYYIIKYVLYLIFVILSIIGLGAFFKGKSSERAVGLIFLIIALVCLLGGYLI